MGLIDRAKNTIIKSLGGVTDEESIGDGFMPYYLEKDSAGLIEVDPQAKTMGAPTEVDFTILYRIYKQESWVRACIDTIRRGVTANSYDFESTIDDASPNNESYLKNFFKYPNPEDSFDDILGDVSTDLLTYGNAYLEVVKDGRQRVKELYNLDATTMKIKHDEHGNVLGYRQEVITGGDVGSVDFEPDEIIHFRLTSKGSGMYGLSPLISLIRVVDTDLKAQIYVAKYFENFGAPKALFKFKNANAEQIRRNRLYLATQVAGVENSHRNLILEGDVEYQALSTGMRDTEVLKIRRFQRDEIFAVYGVPPSKVSIIESGNIGGGTGDSQDKTFKLETILPLQRKIAQKINHKLIKGAMGIFDWELTFGEVLDIDRLQEAKIHEVYVKSGILLKNEVREELGLQPLDEMDEKKEDEELAPEDKNKPVDPKDPKDDKEEKVKDKEDEKKEDVIAVKKGLDIDFSRFEPLREQTQKFLEAYVKNKIAKVANYIEEEARAKGN